MFQDQSDIDRLLSLIRAGSQPALEEFYEVTVNRVFSVVLKITSRHELAEEVVSDVYLQVWRSAHKYDEKKSKPLSWLLMIAYSRAIDAIRSEAVKAKYEDSYDDYPESFSSPDDDPSATVFNKEQGSALEAAIQLLNEQQRHLVNLAFYKGMSHQEIADYTGMPLGTVKSNLRRAQDVLRSTLNKSDLIKGVNYGHA
jgi:RNA polymerase sigma-70 factor (ECF subfamily)